MSKYLTALKGQDFCTPATRVLEKLQKGASCSYCSDQVSDLRKYQGVETAANEGEAYRGWELHFPDRDPLEVIFAPEQTHAEVLALYPTACAAIPWAHRTADTQPVQEAVAAPADGRGRIHTTGQGGRNDQQLPAKLLPTQ